MMVPETRAPSARPMGPIVNPIRLDDPSLFINRELALLEFDARVLEQAKDPETPLLERVRFLAICSTNLDEFFEIRVAGLREFAHAGLARSEPDGMSATDTLKRVSERAHQLVAEQYRVLNEVLLPELAKQKIQLLRRPDWSARVKRWTRRFFLQQVLPVLTPVGLDPAHPFPRILNKSLNFIVTVEGIDAYGRSAGIAVVQVPRSLPRLIRLPSGVGDGDHDFLLLSSVVHAHVSDLFPGMRVTGCYQFRVTRNADLLLDEEEADDLLRELKGELPRRGYGETVRLEVADSCPEEMCRFLLEKFELGEDSLYRCPGPVNLNRLAAIHGLVDRPDLKYRPFTPRVAPSLQQADDLFDALRKTDRLLHHPFDSFSPVVDLIRQAARDPNVLAIKQTLYRTGSQSPIVAALLDAARAGKEVTVLVELRARFDEEANIDLATKLQEAGAKVAYGIVGYKTHSKMLMIVRREEGKLRRYVHLGTGNYHDKTALAYTDIGLLSADRELGEDVHNLFNQLTGLGRPNRLTKLIQAPFRMLKELKALIDRETANAKKGKPARIIAKMNALTEPEVIQALYRASQAGVPIDLIVRGVCALRPGVPGVSDTIRVRSIIGRFLEHSRIFYFHAGGEPILLCASADWMTRNLRWRVETCFPIEDQRLKNRLIHEALELYVNDNVNAWVMQTDGSYKKTKPGASRPRPAQTLLLDRISDSSEREVTPKIGVPSSVTREARGVRRKEGNDRKGRVRPLKAPPSNGSGNGHAPNGTPHPPAAPSTPSVPPTGSIPQEPPQPSTRS